MDRDDLTASIPDFVVLFESNVNTEGALRTQFNRTSVSLPTVAGQNYVSTPSDYLGVDTMVLTKSGGGFETLKPYGSPFQMYTDYPNAAVTTGQPKGFVNLVSKLELAPTPDAVYANTLYYYQKVPPLVTNTTNWLMTNFPQIYLFGTLLAAEAFMGGDPAISKWGSLYDNAIQKLQGATDRNKYGGSGLIARIDAVA
jgi:hypothetical protein